METVSARHARGAASRTSRVVLGIRAKPTRLGGPAGRGRDRPCGIRSLPRAPSRFIPPFACRGPRRGTTHAGDKDGRDPGVEAPGGGGRDHGRGRESCRPGQHSARGAATDSGARAAARTKQWSRNPPGGAIRSAIVSVSRRGTTRRHHSRFLPGRAGADPPPELRACRTPVRGIVDPSKRAPSDPKPSFLAAR